MMGKFGAFGAVLTAILLAMWPARVAVQASYDDVQVLFRHYFETKLADDPEFATTTGHYENSDRWDDWSKMGRDARKKHEEETLAELKKISVEGLS